MSSPTEDSDHESKDEADPIEPTGTRPQHGVRRKLRTLAFGRRRKEASKKRKSPWTIKFGPRSWHSQNFDVSEPGPGCSSCICTVYRKTEQIGTSSKNEQPAGPVDDWDERARMQRAREIEEGVDPPPGYQPRHEQKLSELSAALRLSLTVSPYPYLERLGEAAGLTPDLLAKLCEMTVESLSVATTVHTQVDYIHCLVPDILEITNCGFYWGKMDRYEAELLLEGRPEGTFLLRDSAQEDFLFSVSFRRYGRSLHARVEQWNHAFSFDTHDPGVFASGTVCGLIEHYKDPSCCMYFEPMLTIPLHRTCAFSLQHLCRAAICSRIGYDAIGRLALPKMLKSYLKEYHYKQRVKVRSFDQ